MKQPVKIAIIILTIISAAVIGGASYKNSQSKSDVKQKQTASRAYRTAKLKYDVFEDRAKKAKARGDMQAARTEYLKALNVLEVDFDKAKSPKTAVLISHILSDPNIGITDHRKQLYYAQFVDGDRLIWIKKRLLRVYGFDVSTYASEDIKLICNLYANDVSSYDFHVISSLLRILNRAANNNIDVQSCAGLTRDALIERLTVLPFQDMSSLDDEKLNIILNYADREMPRAKREDYMETYLPIFLNRDTYEPSLSRSITRVVERFGRLDDKQKLLDVLKKTEPKKPYHYYVMGQLYRSRLYEVPDYVASRKMYQKSIDLEFGYSDALINLFYLKYLGLGGPVERAEAADILAAAIEADNLDAKTIKLCLRVSKLQKNRVNQSVKTELEDLTWIVNGRALKAYAAYWGLIDNMTDVEALHLMEDAALDGADWGKTGMALFNRVGFGVEKDKTRADIWQQSLLQEDGDIPSLSLPIESCEPQSAL